MRTMFWMDGYATPSPIPMTPRTTSSDVSESVDACAASGVSSVKRLHSRTPAASTYCGENRVAKYPPKILVIIYPAKKDDDTAPLTDESQPNCSLMGKMVTDMAALSTEHTNDTAVIMPMSNSTSLPMASSSRNNRWYSSSIASSRSAEVATSTLDGNCFMVGRVSSCRMGYFRLAGIMFPVGEVKPARERRGGSSSGWRSMSRSNLAPRRHSRRRARRAPTPTDLY